MSWGIKSWWCRVGSDAWHGFATRARGARTGRCMAVQRCCEFPRRPHGLQTRATIAVAICFMALTTLGAPPAAPPAAPPVPEPAERVEQGLALTFEAANGKA